MKTKYIASEDKTEALIFFDKLKKIIENPKKMKSIVFL